MNPRAPKKSLDKPQLLTIVHNEVLDGKAASVKVSVDLVTLIRIMGERAIRNRWKQSVLLGGGVRVEVFNIRERK